MVYEYHDTVYSNINCMMVYEYHDTVYVKVQAHNRPTPLLTAKVVLTDARSQN